ncbi:HEAT repeat domain-containing protein [Desulfobacter latus]|uniref:HEAT repeat domain-containing protein n=1 Tax=Desulfobacter latus TaxID=2292 RepID=A0A850TH12_9BACT|nr:HEAT repeat domain-containing protein [Desulfobacter latus]NWH06866.1 HEAT repeat domain-containing protein [Desulfobacter latus]
MKTNAKKLLFFTTILSTVFGLLFYYYKLGEDDKETLSSKSKQPHQVKVVQSIEPPELPFSTMPLNKPVAHLDDKKIKPSSSDEAVFLYDEAQEFAQNLKRFKMFCHQNASSQKLEFEVNQFVWKLLKNVQGNGPIIKEELLSSEGHPLYKNILLACLRQAKFENKHEVVWQIVNNRNEDPLVRRTAAFVLGKLPDVPPNPKEFLFLLSDPDDQVKIFALQNAAFHANDDVYKTVKDLAASYHDVNVRMAAVNAMGNISNPNQKNDLINLIEQQATFASSNFSESSLIKRTAVSSLDASDKEIVAFLRQTAIDDEENEGVRRRALLKLSESGEPGITAFMISLLQEVSPAESILLKGCVEALLILNDPAGIQSIQTKLENTEDLDIRNLIQHLMSGPTLEERSAE